VLPDGEHGELVFTSLTKEAFPVIRYRTRDLTRLLPGSARTMRRFDKITGRSDDMLIIRGVNVFPSQIEELILKTDGLAPHYQLEVSRQGHLDRLTINAELSPQTPGAKTDELEQHLAHRVKSYIGVTSRVVVHAPGTVARSQGKAQRVVRSD
jgi:phenylacetate-CoA ligase